MRQQDTVLYIIAALAFAAMACLPALGATGFMLRTLTLALMYALLAQAWNLVGGYAGYAAFGNVAFFGVGATTTAVLMVKLGWAFAPSMLMGAVLCALLALLIGPALLRIRGHYFAVATMAIANATRELVAGWDNVTGGGIGLNLPLNNDRNFYTWVYYGFLILVICAMLLTHWLSRSKTGFAWVAIRENEEGAKALGIDSTRFKTLAWVITAGMVGVVGGIHAYYNAAVSPESVFDPLYSTTPIIIALLGGSGTVIGPILGALILLPLSTFLLFRFPGWQPSLLGIAIILVIIFLPRGLYEYLSGRRKFTLRSLLQNPRENKA